MCCRKQIRAGRDSDLRLLQDGCDLELQIRVETHFLNKPSACSGSDGLLGCFSLIPALSSHPHLILSHSHHSCCLCRFHVCAADPPQHNSPTTRIMSGEGKIKMKKSRSSGEVRRQQDFMRPVQTEHDGSKEKQDSSDVELQSVQLKTLG